MAKGIMIIDGQRVPFDGEKNVLAVIRKAGIDIPTFCYYSELSTYGACRMCMVEDVKTGKLDAPRDLTGFTARLRDAAAKASDAVPDGLAGELRPAIRLLVESEDQRPSLHVPALCVRRRYRLVLERERRCLVEQGRVPHPARLVAQQRPA